ncbi:MAG: FtsX-like permease family protein [Luteitalea sp.]|nr:FtsX-like permease family protein [Luteitalea sp.]
MSPSELWRRVAFLLRRARRTDELDEELQLHVQLREQQLRDRGLAPEQAARAAKRQFGNPTRLKEDSRDAWGWRWLDDLLHDMRYAARLLRLNPLFAVVVVLTLALGIGPNTAIFSVMNAVVLRYLPVPEPDRLVYVRTSHQPDGTGNTGDYGSSFSYDVYAQLRTQRHTVSDLMAFVPLALNKTAVRYGTSPEEASASMVSGNFFTGLGVRAACGRMLTMEDETNRASVVVLSHAYWSRRFGETCGIIGETLHVKGVPFTIVGVAAQGFEGVETASATDLWVPLQDRLELNAWGLRRDETYLHSPDWWCLMMIGRLAAGVSEEAALARLQPAYVNAAYAHIGQPKADEKVPSLTFTTTRGIAGLRETYQEPLRLLLAMVFLVLVIACGNVALLLVARDATRQREFAVRVAVGGNRLRLLRQLLAEGLLLVAAGMGLGWLFALAATDVLNTWSSLNVDLAPDGRVLLFTLGVSVLVTLIFGLAPLGSAIRLPLSVALKPSTSTAHQDRRRTSVRKTVIALQVALCLMLLVGAGLLARTLHNLGQVPLGMRTSGLLVFGISPHAEGHPATVRFYEALLDRLRALPGVEAVTLMERRIGSGWSNNTTVLVDGKVPHTDRGTLVRWNSVGPDYFGTLKVPLLYGRDIRDTDGPNAPKVVVVNDTFVKQYLVGRNALGRSVAISSVADAAQYQIVGVAADSKYTSVRETPVPMAYFPYKQMEYVSAMHVELRTVGDPEPFLPVVQRVVREIAPDLPIEQPRTQQQQFAMTFMQDRLFARLALFFGLLAMVLVATGLYGTLTYTVSRRTAEIGVRVALGAQRRDVLWMVLRESLVVCVAGIAIGLPLAIAGSRMLRSLLYGVSPGDPLTLVGSLAALMMVALVASLLPARRAASVEPITTLRTE